MTPEEQFSRDVWWILREIRNDELLTPKGKKIEFRIRAQPKISSRSKQVDSLQFPSEDTQKKLLYKLQEWRAIVNVEPVNDILRGSDAFNPKIYQLSINQKKFSEIYRKYEGSLDEGDVKPQAPTAREKEIPSLNLDHLNYEQSFFLLRITYKKLIDILDVVCGGYLGIRNETINYYYTVLKESVDNMLARGRVKGWASDLEKPELFESLIGDVEEADIEWEFLRKKAYEFLGKIEKSYILLGRPTFNLPSQFTTLLENTDEALKSHKEFHDKAWGEKAQKIKDQMEKAGWGQSRNSNVSNDSSITRKALEKRWDVLQVIWDCYESANFPSDELNIPIAYLEIKGRNKAQIIDIFKGFEREGCFTYSHRGSKNYLVKDIVHDHLLEIFNKTGDTYKKVAKTYEERKTDSEISKKISLSSQKIEFDDDKSVIKIGDKECPLPPYKNEHYLCRAMFKRPVGEFVSWDIIYQEMTEVEFPPPEKWRTVYDSMEALNKRIGDIIKTNDELFTWVEKTMKRNY